MNVAECLLENNVPSSFGRRLSRASESISDFPLQQKYFTHIERELNVHDLSMFYATSRGLSLCSDCKWKPIPQWDYPSLLSCPLIFS